MNAGDMTSWKQLLGVDTVAVFREGIAYQFEILDQDVHPTGDHRAKLELYNAHRVSCLCLNWVVD